MQNRGLIWTFTILLILACVYHLLFGYFTGKFENEQKSLAYNEAIPMMKKELLIESTKDADFLKELIAHYSGNINIQEEVNKYLANEDSVEVIRKEKRAISDDSLRIGYDTKISELKTANENLISEWQNDFDISKLDPFNRIIDVNGTIPLNLNTVDNIVSDVNNQDKKNFSSNYLSKVYENKLIENGNQPIFPLLGLSYKFCKDHELKFGLDLSGGMSVALEVSIPDLVNNLAGKPNVKEFREPFDAAVKEYSENSSANFIDIFYEKYKAANTGYELARFFDFGREEGLSDDEIISELKTRASEAIDKTEAIISERVSSSGTNQPTITKQASTGRLLVELPGIRDKETARRMLQSTAELEFWDTYQTKDAGNYVYTEMNRFISSLENDNLYDSIEDLRKRQGELLSDTNKFVLDSNNQNIRDSLDKFVLQAGIKLDSADSVLAYWKLSEEEKKETEEKLSPFTYVVYPALDRNTGGWLFNGEGATLGYARVTDTAIVNKYIRQAKEAGEVFTGNFQDLDLMWDTKVENADAGTPIMNLQLVRKTASGESRITGEEIESARQDFNQVGEPVVIMIMKSKGATAWEEMTQVSYENQRPNAITLDGKVISSATARNGKISGGVTEISGFGLEEAKYIANVLNAGSLPAPARIVQESSVGPSLGAENIRRGRNSFIIALVLVLIYMIFYYAKAGIVSDIALVLNILILFGVLASITSSLTLPGIAGIVLTIGMAVDANVLIFERIREELRSGKNTKQAIKDGYSRAYSAILDANITTLVTAFVLGYFGSGPIKGFATTLLWGVLTSLFCAIVITRLVFSYMLDAKQKVTFSTALTRNAFQKVNFDFIGKRKLFYVVSGLIIAAGVASLATKKLDLGVEFTGGRSYTVSFKEEANLDKVRNELEKVFGEKPEVKQVNDAYTAKITTQYLFTDLSKDANHKVDSTLLVGLANVGELRSNEIQSEQIDQSFSSTLITSSIWAIIISLLFIFLYIVVRFRKWQFGLGALLAMFHDVLIVLSLFSILYGILPFSMEIDQAFIAAILTVVGYSINDTVVVFDRIREYFVSNRREDNKSIINKALNSTLSRTVNTSLTTFLVLLIIFLFGGESIKGFSFALMIGVIVGTYSSLFIATPSVVDFTPDLDDLKKQKKSKR